MSFACFERVRDDGCKLSTSRGTKSRAAEAIFLEVIESEKKRSEKIVNRPRNHRGSLAHMNSESLTDKELRFINAERLRLEARGITDYDEQSIEIAKRWAVIKQFIHDTSPPNVDVSQPAGLLFVDEPYSDKEADELGLIMVDCDMSNTPRVRFIYKLASDVSSKTSAVGAAAGLGSASAAPSPPPKIAAEKCEYIDGPFEGRIEGY
eukprot:528976-Prymnesium_polylepis.1